MATPTEAIGFLGFLINVLGVVWGAAKISSKVEELTNILKDLRVDFKDLKDKVSEHETALALLGGRRKDD